MKNLRNWILVLFVSAGMSSCEFSCQMGGSDDPKGKVKKEEGALVYNDIKVNTFKAKLKRAYLLFEDNTRVPDDNRVDFSQPIKLILDLDGGWEEANGRVQLGVSEKVIDETGAVLLDEPDLFANNNEGVTVQDARRLAIKASIRVTPNAPPTSFSVQFKVWDKKGDGFIEGSYMLFSK
jgi:hypothetical protein